MINDKFYFVTPDGCLVEIPSVLADSVGIELVGITPKEAYSLRRNQLINERKQLLVNIENTERYMELVEDKLNKC